MNKYVFTRMDNRLLSARYNDDKLYELSFYDDNNNENNIYVGRVENVVKNINCAFIEIKQGIKCFYSLDDNKRHIFLNKKNNSNVNIGDILLIQIARESIKTKPATASSKLSLTGNYLVLSNDIDGISISSKTKKNAHCLELKDILISQLKFTVPYDDLICQSDELEYALSYGFILRTNSSTATASDVITEAMQLIDKYKKILKMAVTSKAFNCVYSDNSKYIDKIRHIKDDDLSEIVTDNSEIFEQLSKSLNFNDSSKIRLYKDDLLSLSKLYSLETELERALNKKVWLKSGGYLIIEQTEALTVIDVNTGKMVTKKSGDGAKESSFFALNIEAATEIARQLSLRNLSGIIIIDFINMKSKENNNALMEHLKKITKKDTISTKVIDITALGLIELTRQKDGKSLSEVIGVNTEYEKC